MEAREKLKNTCEDKREANPQWKSNATAGQVERTWLAAEGSDKEVVKLTGIQPLGGNQWHASQVCFYTAIQGGQEVIHQIKS